MNIAHNTTVQLTCPGRMAWPLWYINGTLAQSPEYTVQVDPGTGDQLAMLTLDGNIIHGTLDLNCTLRGRTVYTNRLTIQGLLHVCLLNFVF